ncbi:MAG TPA: hypothetical protein DDZ84_03270, partial [Firmicutes bacterium]|nr:hypothetical protein [Bacillota bacterium]
MPDDMEESPVCSEVGMPDYLGVFTTSMKTYRRFSEHLPVNGHVVDLANGAKKASDVVGETNESDYFGVMIRLMLQRKYFQRGGDHKKPNPLFIRNLVKTAQGSYPDQSDTWQHVLERLDDLKKCEVQVSLPDGTVQAGFFDNVQDVTYGALLHADPDKLERVAQIPESMQTIYVGEYVMARERILVDFSDALQASGVKTLDSHKTERKASVYMGL